MHGQRLPKTARGATATGASAIGAATWAAASLGAVALGAMAMGALAIGRLSVGQARLRRVEIGALSVGRLEIGADPDPGAPVVVCQLRAAPGRGDDLERHLREHVTGRGAVRLLRADADPDLFLLQETCAAGGAHRPKLRLAAVLRRCALEGQLAPPDANPADLQIYRAI